ncbi:MAG: alpha/beta fold hydrolase [Wenzhouxiangellaceae bacterium]
MPRHATAENVQIETADGVTLNAVVLEPKTAVIKATIMLSSGTAIPKGLYLKYALYLAENGYVVALYDYRGIGDDTEALKSQAHYRMREWGSEDMPAVLDWLRARYPDYPSFILAHSMGGQLIGLMRNHAEVSGIYTISTSIGYWRDMSGLYKYFCMVVWFVLVPLLPRFFGYFPTKKIGLGENMATGVIAEWAQWCRNRDYFSHCLLEDDSMTNINYEKITKDIYALGFTDDPIANRTTIPKMMRYYRNANVTIDIIDAQSVGMDSIGHHGFFSSKSKEKLWPKPLAWFEHQLSRQSQ